MKHYDFETWDVFTAERFAGNQLAVLMDAEGLGTDEMQTIAREFNFAETSFVLPPEDPNHTARVRIFTPAYEMPYAGHPTVGTAIAVAKARGLSGGLTLELNAGLFPVETNFDGAAPFAQFQNPNAPRETGDAPSADLIEAALSLPEGSIDRGQHKPRRLGAGVDYVCARAPLDVVAKAKVNSADWGAMGLENIVGVYLYADGGTSPDVDWHVRMFAPDAGVFEDAATGSAAATFPGQVALSETLNDGVHRWKIEQGIEMGRPALIEVEFETKDSVVESVRIGGAAALVMRGQIVV